MSAKPLKISSWRVHNGAKIASKRLPGGLRGGSGRLLATAGDENGSQERPQVTPGALLGALGAVLGSSGELLGRSWGLLGRSWGSFWPPRGRFLELFGSYFWRLGPGPSKIKFFNVFIVVCVFCLGPLFGPLLPCSRRPRRPSEL